MLVGCSIEWKTDRAVLRGLVEDEFEAEEVLEEVGF